MHTKQKKNYNKHKYAHRHTKNRRNKKKLIYMHGTHRITMITDNVKTCCFNFNFNYSIVH